MPARVPDAVAVGNRPLPAAAPPFDDGRVALSRLPEEDQYPHHRYGNFTHRSPSGSYAFEWTPFRPAIVAWRSAEGYLQSALRNLTTAQELTGFALNGLHDEYGRMMACLREYAKQVETAQGEAGKVVRVLEIADRDYAQANEASAEEYHSLMRRIDEVTTGQAVTRKIEDDTEQALEANPGSLPFEG
jgi:hypothetical protein